MPSPALLSGRSSERSTQTSAPTTTTSGPQTTNDRRSTTKRSLKGLSFEEQEAAMQPHDGTPGLDGTPQEPPRWMQDLLGPGPNRGPELGPGDGPPLGPRRQDSDLARVMRWGAHTLEEIVMMLPPGADREFTPVLSAAELREQLEDTSHSKNIWAALGGAVAGELAFSLFDAVFYQIGRNLGPGAVLVYRAIQGSGQAALALGLLELFGFESAWAFMKLWNGFVADLGYYLWAWIQDKAGLDIPTFEGADALDGGLANHGDVSWASWTAWGQVKGTNAQPEGPEAGRMSGKEVMTQAIVASVETLIEPLLAKWIPGFDLELGLSKTFKVGFRASGQLAEIDGRPVKLHVDAYNVGPGQPYLGGGLQIPFELGGKDGQLDVQAGHDPKRGWNGRVGVELGL